MSWRWYAPKRALTFEEAQGVKCPMCARPPGSGCVWTTGPLRGRASKRPHVDRFQLARRRMGERAMREAEAAVLAGGPPLRDPALLRALQDHDRREHDQLRAWLGQHGHLFFGLA